MWYEKVVCVNIFRGWGLIFGWWLLLFSCGCFVGWNNKILIGEECYKIVNKLRLLWIKFNLMILSFFDIFVYIVFNNDEREKGGK